VKDANSSTRLKPGTKQVREAPAPPAPGDEHRAEPQSEQHRANQEELGVTEDHQSEDMKRKKRGTFP
jgi:hypothetical protein